MESVHDKSYNFSSSIYHVQSEKVPYTKHWWHHAKSVVQMSFNPLPASDLCTMGWNNFWRRARIILYASGLLGPVRKILVVQSGPERPQFACSVGILQYGTAMYASLKLQQKGLKKNLNYYLKESNNKVRKLFISLESIFAET